MQSNERSWVELTMKTDIEIIDRTGRRAPPFRSEHSSRLIHSTASTATRPVTAFAEPFSEGSSSSGDGQSRLTAISTQGFLSPTIGPMIAGFIIRGSAPQRILLRAAGPALAELGLKKWLAYPRIQFFDGSGASLGENNVWGTEVADLPNWIKCTDLFPFRPEPGCCDDRNAATGRLHGARFQSLPRRVRGFRGGGLRDYGRRRTPPRSAVG